jgi:hypothetical protein
MLAAAGGPPQSISAPVAFPKPGKEEKRRQAAAVQKKAREKRRPEGRRYECAPGMRSFRARGTILNWTGRRARGSPSTWA